jgi:hypothetical protein
VELCEGTVPGPHSVDLPPAILILRASERPGPGHLRVQPGSDVALLSHRRWALSCVSVPLLHHHLRAGPGGDRQWCRGQGGLIGARVAGRRKLLLLLVLVFQYSHLHLLLLGLPVVVVVVIN